MERNTDHPKRRGQAIGNGSTTWEIGRRTFLKGVIMGTAAGPSVVGSAWGGDLVSSAHAQEAGDAASRAASAATALARRKPGARLRILEPFNTLAQLRPIVERWTKDTGIPVEHIEVPALEINQRILQKEPFDVALARPPGIPDFAASGVLVDLTELAQQYDPDRHAKGCEVLYNVADFYQGRLFGFCCDGDALVMFYRKDLLDNPEEQKRFADQYGYPLSVPATWNEFDQIVRFFHRPNQGLHGGAMPRAAAGGVASIAEWIIRYHAKGHYPFDDHMHPQINNDGGVEALEEWITDYLDGARTNTWFQHVEAYRAGRSFAHLGYGADQKAFWDPRQSRVYGKLTWGLPPGGTIEGELLRTPFFTPGHSYVVSKYSPIPEIAYLFCQYAYSPKMSTIAVREQGFLDPFRECHFTDPATRDAYGGEYLDVLHESLRLSIPDLYLRGREEYFDVLTENLQAADLGQKNPRRRWTARPRPGI